MPAKLLEDLPLESIDLSKIDMDSNASLAELHAMFGIAKKPDANNINYISKRLEKRGTRKAQGRGRPATLYRVGDFYELLRGSRSSVRSSIPPMRARTGTKSVTTEEIIAHLKLRNIGTVDTSVLTKVFAKHGIKPVGKRRASGSGRGGRPKNLYDLDDVNKLFAEGKIVDRFKNTGPYGGRPARRVKSSSAEELKVIGLGLGRRGLRDRRPHRRGSRIDGDGDGFYSPRPGMPDKTPVPVGMVENEVVSISEEAFSEATSSSKRQVAIAIEASKKIEQSVIEQYGEIRTRQQALSAMKKAFPNAKVHFLSGRSNDHEITHTERSLVIGLLHGATLKPKTAKRLKLFGKIGNSSNSSGWHKFRMMDDRVEFVSLDLKTDFHVNRVISMNGRSLPWAAVIVGEGIRHQEFDKDDLNLFYNTAVALHEFGHAMHLDAALTDLGVDDEDQTIPFEFLAKCYTKVSGVDIDRLKEEVDLRVAEQNNMRPEMQQTGWSNLTEDQKRNKKLLQIIRASGTQVNDAFRNEFYRSAHWDRVPDEKRQEILQTLAKVSGYAAQHPDREFYSQAEGIAESFSHRELFGGTSRETSRDSEKYLRWAMTKAAKMNESSEPSIDSEYADSCAGYVNIDEDGNMTPASYLPPEPRVQKVDFDELLKKLDKEEKSEQFLESQSQKILGIGIGKRGPRGGRVRRRHIPQDGDGDGFYSPRPGMPDKTPVPIQEVTDAIVTIGEEAFDQPNMTKREIAVALATAKKIEADIIKKYGEIKTRRQAMSALGKAFPNARIEFFSGDELTSDERNFTIGLLHGAELKPKAAKRLGLIAEETNPNYGGSHNYGLNGNTFPRSRIYLNKISSTRIWPRGREVRVGEKAPWEAVVAAEMHNSGDFSVEDIDQFYLQSIALHEFGHLAHYDAALSDMGGAERSDGSTYIPNEIFAEAIGKVSLQRTEDVLDYGQQVVSYTNGSSQAPPDWDSLTEDEKLGKALVGILGKLYAAKRNIHQDEGQRFIQSFLDIIDEEMHWDGVPEDKREDITKSLMKASAYASSEPEARGRHLEGVAETFVRREMTGGALNGERNRDAARHMRWVMTKVAKNEKTGPIPFISTRGCSGLGTLTADGFKPSPEKPKSPKVSSKPIDLEKIMKDFQWN
jgi:hypothetical protein